MTGRPVYLKHLSHYLPGRVLDNRFFEQILETDDAWIRQKTGIAERRHMDDYRGPLPVCEIGRRAVDQLVAGTGYDLACADLLVAAAGTDDLQYPGPANLLSEHYGLHIPAFQMKNACSSVVYALEVCRGLLQLGSYRDILIVTGEPFTLQADYGDRRSAILFGDAATAMVVSSEPGLFEIEGVAVGGRGSRVIHATAPGARPGARIDDALAGETPPRAGHDAPGWGCFAQQGRAVFDFVLDTMPAEIETFLASMGRAIGDVEWFIAHQANLVLLEKLCQKLGVPPDRHLHNVERIGNVSSAGWVTVLSEELAAGCFATGDRILVSAFGAGLAWGSTLLRKL